MTAWTQSPGTTARPRAIATPIARLSRSYPAETGAGTEAEAELLFARVYPQLAGWVRRLVDDDDDTSHEIASEAFVRLLSRSARVDRPQQYLYVIAANLIRDHWRKTRRERSAFAQATTVAATAEAVVNPVQDVEVRQLVGSLPVRLREPFLLHYYGGFRVCDVAALLGRPEGTVKADLFAARAALKAALRLHERDEADAHSGRSRA
jgi:RNA polymerase sigma-70 factor, ECF subfamily